MLNQQTSSHQAPSVIPLFFGLFVCLLLLTLTRIVPLFWMVFFVPWAPSSHLGKQSFVVTADLWLEDEVTDRNLVLVSSIPSSRTAAYTQQQHAAQSQESQQGIGPPTTYLMHKPHPFIFHPCACLSPCLHVHQRS